MSRLEEARHLLERAEQAAMGGDFVTADELLESAATIQQQELGLHHPDLANTLNNLAIVAEKTGRTSEAETLYRRAASIAAAALPSDHPMVVETKQNLADFCRAHGVPVHPPPPPPVHPPPPPVAAPIPAVPRPDLPLPAPIASEPVAPASAPGKASHSLAWLAIGALVLVVVVFFLLSRSRSSDETSTPAAAPEPTTSQPAQSTPPPTKVPAARAPSEQASRPKDAPRKPDRPAATEQPSARGAVTLAIAQVCRGFSTSGSRWRCDPAEGSATPGPLVFYTRVKSPHETAVVHRWYQGNTLRQSVRLGIHGNATEGYRTYSRQTVTAGDWRVEVRSADGALLHEERFVVK
jgi:hypothetical protein